MVHYTSHNIMLKVILLYNYNKDVILRKGTVKYFDQKDKFLYFN